MKIKISEFANLYPSGDLELNELLKTSKIPDRGFLTELNKLLEKVMPNYIPTNLINTVTCGVFEIKNPEKPKDNPNYPDLINEFSEIANKYGTFNMHNNPTRINIAKTDDLTNKLIDKAIDYYHITPIINCATIYVINDIPFVKLMYLIKKKDYLM